MVRICNVLLIQNISIIHYFSDALCLSQSGNLGVEMRRPSRFSSAVILTFLEAVEAARAAGKRALLEAV